LTPDIGRGTTGVLARGGGAPGSAPDIHCLANRLPPFRFPKFCPGTERRLWTALLTRVCGSVKQKRPISRNIRVEIQLSVWLAYMMIAAQWRYKYSVQGITICLSKMPSRLPFRGPCLEIYTLDHGALWFSTPLLRRSLEPFPRVQMRRALDNGIA
jgi:hypothetical protein